MSLFQQACVTYDAMLSVVKPGDDFPLAPVSHTVKQPNIEITIDKDGAFQSARLRQIKSVKQKDGTWLKAEPMVIMPVTEKSLGRGTGAERFPHYLCDYVLYFHPGNKVAYESYLSQLDAWASYARHPKLDAVLAYVKSGTILQDLDGLNLEYTEKSLVCWVVNGLGLDDSGPCWLDKSLMDSLVSYHASIIQNDGHKTGLCMVTGEHTILSALHPKGIVRLYGNAKLISSNSSSNNAFTYMGRFTDAEQALTVGYEASQKAHNALAWLVANQGVNSEGRIFLCWNPHGLEIPSVTGFMARDRHTGNRPATPSDYKKKLRDSLTGWKLDLPEDAKAVFVIFDAPTTGCLSVLCYNEMSCHEYLANLYEWELRCCAGNYTPSLGNLVRYAYGSPQDGKFEVKPKVYSQHFQRLVLCRLDGIPFPLDIEKRLVYNASNLVSCNESGDKIKGKKKGAGPREKLLHAACSAIRKYRYDTKKEEWKMGLDTSCTDRSYLFGRLLAIAEKVEGKVLYAKSSDRETRALRLQRAFSQRPMSTWRNIHENLDVYFAQLPSRSRNYYRKLISEVMSMLPKEGLNLVLDDVYLLGYYEQRAELKYKASGSEDATNQEPDNNQFEEEDEV